MIGISAQWIKSYAFLVSLFSLLFSFSTLSPLYEHLLVVEFIRLLYQININGISITSSLAIYNILFASFHVFTKHLPTNHYNYNKPYVIYNRLHQGKQKRHYRVYHIEMIAL